MTTNVPTLETRSNELTNAIALDMKLSQDEIALKAEARKQTSVLGKNAARRARAERIVAGELPDTPAPRNQELDETFGKLRDIELAHEILREKIKTIRLRESRRLCLELKPAFDAIAKRHAGALAEVYETQSEMFKLESELRRQDISFFPTVCNLATELVLGSVNDGASPLARLLRECVEFGYLSKLPKGLKG